MPEHARNDRHRIAQRIGRRRHVCIGTCAELSPSVREESAGRRVMTVNRVNRGPRVGRSEGRPRHAERVASTSDT